MVPGYRSIVQKICDYCVFAIIYVHDELHPKPYDVYIILCRQQ